MKTEWKKAISEMRDAGYCIIVWTPDELGEVDPEWVEECSISYASEYLIDDRSTEERGV